MRARSGWLVISVILAEAITMAIVVLHIGDSLALLIGRFAPIVGAFFGGILTLLCAASPRLPYDWNGGRWARHEQLSWILIGCGVLLWGGGECFWRYYLSMGPPLFPSLADIGYASFPVLVFTGLLLQPTYGAGQRRLMLTFDSLIATGAMLALAWYFLLGKLSQMPGETMLAKVLGLYYPTTDVLLLSCIVFLLLREQQPLQWLKPRHIPLLAIGLGLCFFVTSDFIFNIQQNARTYVEATWIDLGWPLGMITIGLAAYFRRFSVTPPVDPEEYSGSGSAEPLTLKPAQLLPYLLLAGLFVALIMNALAKDRLQQEIRPVLLLATLSVVGLVIIRQLIIMRENAQLLQQQESLLKEQQQVNEKIVEMSCELESGIAHLQEVLARLANGDLQARATIPRGHLWPLAQSLNLLAIRLARTSSRTSQLMGQHPGYQSRVTRSHPIVHNDT